MWSLLARAPSALAPAPNGSLLRRLVLGVLWAVVVLGLAGHVASLAAGLAPDGLWHRHVGLWSQNAAVAAAAAIVLVRAVAARDLRGPWALLAAALGAWAAGNVWWSLATVREAAPVGPSPADLGWLGFYPLAAASFLVLAHRTRATRHVAARLDGLIGLLSVAAIGAAFTIVPVLEAVPAELADLVVRGAYPILDVLLVGLAVAVPLAHREHSGWETWLVGAGFCLFATADSLYGLGLAAGTYRPGGIVDLLWSAGAALMAAAACRQRRPDRVPAPSLTVRFAPVAFGGLALVLLVASACGAGTLGGVLLSAGALLAFLVRMGLTLKELQGLAQSRREAATDELTGLPNRRAFDRHLRDRIAATGTVEGAGLAVLLIDLDDFKDVNDTLGHQAGDALLRELSSRLQAALRAGDHLARLGGDEFVAVIDDAARAEAVGARLAAAMERPMRIAGVELKVRGSIGIARFPEHGTESVTLLQRADVAMYEAKANRTGAEVYAADRDRHSRQRLTIAAELRDAIPAGQLTLHYQPKLDLASGKVLDVEALVRWPHPERGLLIPGEFVPLAQQAGLMPALTAYVLEAALAQHVRWRKAGLDLGVAVNVSATNLHQKGWTAGVLEALERRGVAPGRLALEITEDVLVGDDQGTLATIAALAEAGVRISVDDFGTGHSSLAYLKHLPVRELKIDRVFVADLAAGGRDEAIVQTMIDLGRRLGIDVVAEGVEDAAALARLRELGATAAQGFHVARPQPAEDVGRLLGAAHVGVLGLGGARGAADPRLSPRRSPAAR